MTQSFRERWRQMSQRERTLVSAGGIVLGLSLLFILIVDPLLDTLDRLDRQEVRKQKDLAAQGHSSPNIEKGRQMLAASLKKQAP